MESWIEGIKPRCGPLADAALAFTAVQGLEVDPPRGVDALIALARAIEHQRAQAGGDAERERRFIELAGGFFAAALADTLATGQLVERGGEHRLRLGRFGSFDPFASIERALSADNTKRCLVEQIAEAESFADGSAMLARVASEVLSTLEARFKQVRFVDCFDTVLRLEVDHELVRIDLSRAAELCEAEGAEQIAPAVASLLSRLCGAGQLPGAGFAALRERIVPRLMSESFLRSLPASHDLVTDPLGAGVIIAYLVRFESRARYLRAGELSNEERSAVRPSALANLAARSDRARLVHVETTEGPLVVAQSHDGLDSSRLLLPGLHALLAPELGSPFLAVAPQRDALYAAPQSPAGARMLSARARADAARARHPIGDRLFEVHAGGRVVPHAGAG